jgi:drug/metabolite transporter (DMT)-like permease
VQYNRAHFAGVLTALMGAGLLVIADGTGHSSGATKANSMIIGDVLSVASSILFSLSNLAQEYVVKSYVRFKLLSFTRMRMHMHMRTAPVVAPGENVIYTIASMHV